MSWQLAQWLSTSGGCGPEPWLSDKPGTQLCKAPAWWAPHPPHWAHGSHWAGSWGVVHVKPPPSPHAFGATVSGARKRIFGAAAFPYRPSSFHVSVDMALGAERSSQAAWAGGG